MQQARFWMAACAVFLAFLGTHAAAPMDWLVDPSPFKAHVAATNDGRQIVLQNGLVRRVVQLGSNAATVEFSSVTTGESWLRAVKPEAVVEIDGQRLEVGGLKGQPNRAFLRPEWLRTMTSSPTAFRYVGHVVGKTAERMPWKRVRHHAPDVAWPPPGVSLRLDFASPAGMAGDVRVSVHYELYDGLPAFSKWIVVTNRSSASITIDRFTVERLAIVEQSNPVDDAPGVILPHPDCLHVETDQAFGGFGHEHACRHAVRWREDPAFGTQVNYERSEEHNV